MQILNFRLRTSEFQIAGIFWLLMTSFCWAQQADPVQTFENRPYCRFEPENGKHNGLHVVFLAGDEEYRSEEAFPMLARILAGHHGFRCTVLFSINPTSGEIDPNNQENIPHLEQIASADLIVMGWRFRHPPVSSMKYFLEYLNAGKPIVGIRTSTHAFSFPEDSPSELKRLNWNSNDWPGGFGKHVLGETWVSHHGNHGSQSTRGILETSNKEHPILRGYDGIWGPTDVYGVGELPGDATILVRGQVLKGMDPKDEPVEGKQNDPMMPLIWTREFSVNPDSPVGRYVCSTIGAADDFSCAGLRRVFVNSCYWCLRREAEIPEKCCVDFIGEYRPTKFGFNAFQKGRQPRDYNQ